MNEQQDMVKGWMEEAESEAALVEKLMDFTAEAKNTTRDPAQRQLNVLEAIYEVARMNGMPAEMDKADPADKVMKDQAGRLRMYRTRALALGEKDLAVIVHKLFPYRGGE